MFVFTSQLVLLLTYFSHEKVRRYLECCVRNNLLSLYGKLDSQSITKQAKPYGLLVIRVIDMLSVRIIFHNQNSCWFEVVVRASSRAYFVLHVFEYLAPNYVQQGDLHWMLLFKISTVSNH